ncbi:MAG: hypothetical protein J0L84_08085 [Verrucomicrobia bacterium]|nr:hypothetical protein [Verrucomicrobiota bacterium]
MLLLIAGSLLFFSLRSTQIEEAKRDVAAINEIVAGWEEDFLDSAIRKRIRVAEPLYVPMGHSAIPLKEVHHFSQLDIADQYRLVAGSSTSGSSLIPQTNKVIIRKPESLPEFRSTWNSLGDKLSYLHIMDVSDFAFSIYDSGRDRGVGDLHIIKHVPAVAIFDPQSAALKTISIYSGSIEPIDKALLKIPLGPPVPRGQGFGISGGPLPGEQFAISGGDVNGYSVIYQNAFRKLDTHMIRFTQTPVTIDFQATPENWRLLTNRFPYVESLTEYYTTARGDYSSIIPRTELPGINTNALLKEFEDAFPMAAQLDDKYFDMSWEALKRHARQDSASNSTRQISILGIEIDERRFCIMGSVMLISAQCYLCLVLICTKARVQLLPRSESPLVIIHPELLCILFSIFSVLILPVVAVSIACFRANQPSLAFLLVILSLFPACKSIGCLVDVWHRQPT